MYVGFKTDHHNWQVILLQWGLGRRIRPFTCTCYVHLRQVRRAIGRRSLGQKRDKSGANAKDRLLWAAELLDLAEHLICILETGDRGVVVQFAVTDLKAVGEAVALMKVSMPYQQAHRRTTAVRDVGGKELK
jgi:hypothetical protein